MKTYANLFPRIVDLDNLYLAAGKAQRGKRLKPYVSAFNLNLEREIGRLQQELAAQTYRPGPYQAFKIYDPKERMISCAPFRDRVVHHALCNVIEPIFEARFIFDTYANRKGKGTHKALRRFQHFARGNRYVLKCDVRKYFPSIDHEILFQKLCRRIRCTRTRWLIKTILDGSNPQEPVLGYFPGDDLFTPLERRKGLPIGNLTSQFFANVYLSDLDYLVKQVLHCRFYLRYVDDFALFGDSKRELHEYRAAIIRFLEPERLRLNGGKSRVYRTSEGATFLGFRVFPERVRIKRENVVRFKRRMRRKASSMRAGELGAQDLSVSVRSWIAHASWGDTYRLRSALFSDLLS